MSKDSYENKLSEWSDKWMVKSDLDYLNYR